MAFPWVRVLVEWPARVVEYWFRAYRLLLILTTMVTVTLVVIMLLLALVGVRFGW